MEYVFPGAVLLFFITSLVIVNKEIARRPTFKEVETDYSKKEVCQQIHKSIDEKLECLPEIKKTLIQIETILKIKYPKD